MSDRPPQELLAQIEQEMLRIMDGAIDDIDAIVGRIQRWYVEIAQVRARLDREEPLQHQLNAWREIGEEVDRAVMFLAKGQHENLFPDWFGPRLFDLLVKATAPITGAGDGNTTGNTTTDSLHGGLAMSRLAGSGPSGAEVTHPRPSAVEALAERLESYYDFQCEGGPLKNCVEWQQLRAALASLRETK